MRYIVALFLLMASCGTDNTPSEPGDFTPSGDGEDGDGYVGLSAAGKGDLPDGFGGDIEFAAACEPGEDLVIGAVGDVLLHGRLQIQAYTQPAGAQSLWSGVTDLMQRADITYANFEGPAAPGVNSGGRDVRDPGKTFDDVVYTSYPQFNYHPSVLDALIESGVDVVSTANNHTLDRRSLGADRTIDEINRRSLPYTGSRKSDSTSEEWWTVVDNARFRIAFLACTYGTNGIPDTKSQVLLCFQQADKIETMVRDLAGRSDIDAVVVTPHWGAEYTAIPSSAQFDLAHRLLDAGALAVIGNHPHVIQPWERYVTSDGRETFVMYSIGNFVSGQSHLPRRTTLMLYLGLFRAADGTMKVRGARYVPMHMTRRADGLISLEAVDRVGDFGDSRNHVIELMGASNLMLPDEPIVTNPQCDPAWVPHHPHAGWVGGACENDDACGGAATCATAQPGGLCTLPCSGSCPDVVGRPTTYCIDLGDGAGSCVLKCSSTLDCRTGYTCAPTARFGGTATSNVCRPATP